MKSTPSMKWVRILLDIHKPLYRFYRLLKVFSFYTSWMPRQWPWNLNKRKFNIVAMFITSFKTFCTIWIKKAAINICFPAYITFPVSMYMIQMFIWYISQQGTSHRISFVILKQKFIFLETLIFFYWLEIISQKYWESNKFDSRKKKNKYRLSDKWTHF